MNAVKNLYRRDRHIFRLILMIVLWMIFMAITRFDKFYTLVNFQTMAGQFPEFGRHRPVLGGHRERDVDPDGAVHERPGGQERER